MDGYWETAVIDQAPHYEIRKGEERLGYCAITAERQLLQLYAAGAENAFLALKQLVKRNQVQTAVAGTNDVTFLTNCLRVTDHFSLAINTYLFQDGMMIDLQLPLDDGLYRPATMNDFAALVAFYGRNNEYEDTDAIETEFGGHHKYVKALIEKQQVFLLTQNERTIAVGECRFSHSQPAYADVGMIVDRDFRRRQIGTYVLVQLKKYCYENGSQPICSCAAENIASRKTIEKAGFISQHRLIDLRFEEG